MKSLVDLNDKIKTAEHSLKLLNILKTEILESIEYNTFETLQEAESNLERWLGCLAFNDCEGADNCGSPEYEQEFRVQEQHYLATLTLEYNRHDKTYYYIEEQTFKVEKL